MKTSKYLVVRVRCWNADCGKLFEARLDREKEVVDGKVDAKRTCPYCHEENRIVIEKAESETLYRVAVKGLGVENG